MNPSNETAEKEIPAMDEEVWEKARMATCRMQQDNKGLDPQELGSGRALRIMAAIVGLNTDDPDAAEKFVSQHQAEMAKRYSQALQEGVMRGYQPQEYARETC